MVAVKRWLESLFWELYATCYDVLGKLRAYRELHARVAEFIDSNKSLRILDAGVGTGNLIQTLGNNKTSLVVGIDYCQGMLKVARRKELKAELLQCDLNTGLPFSDASFDAIVSVNNLYILEDSVRTLLEFNRVLVDGGKVVLANPRPGFSPAIILRDHLSRMNGIGDWMELIANIPQALIVISLNVLIVGKGKSGEYNFADEDMLRRWATASGFGVEHVETAYANQDLLVILRKKGCGT